MNVLITGATGNVGLAVIEFLTREYNQLSIFAAVRNPAFDAEMLRRFNVSIVAFDFERTDTFSDAFAGIDVLFLLRPPQLSDVGWIFKPLIEAAKASVKHIVFLSVQGVEKSTLIPHHKIESLIVASGISFTFLRPAYFMQNFTTTLKQDLVEKDRIYLPAGKTKFTVVDVNDIGRVAAKVLTNPFVHKNKVYELTNHDVLSFKEMADLFSKGLGRPIQYLSPNLITFYLAKRREGMPPGLILVMIMLHFLPRFKKTPRTTTCVKDLTGTEPISFRAFIVLNKDQFRRTSRSV